MTYESITARQVIEKLNLSEVITVSEVEYSHGSHPDARPYVPDVPLADMTSQF